MSEEVGKIYKTKRNLYVQHIEDSSQILITDMDVDPEFHGTLELEMCNIKDLYEIVKLIEKDLES